MIYYTGCTLCSDLAMENPGIPLSSNFCYNISITGTVWTIEATRAAVNGGDGALCNADGTDNSAGAGSLIKIDIDFIEAKRILKEIKECVDKGTISYGLMTAEKN